MRSNWLHDFLYTLSVYPLLFLVRSCGFGVRGTATVWALWTRTGLVQAATLEQTLFTLD
jgi:hypothetical protein